MPRRTPFFCLPTEEFLQIQNEWRLRILRKTEESDSCLISECSSNDADLLTADQLELTRIQLQMSQQSEFLLQQKLASLKVQMYKMSVDFANRIHASNFPAPRPPPRRRPFADVLLRRQHNNHSSGEPASSRGGGPTNTSQLSIATSLAPTSQQGFGVSSQKSSSRKERGGGGGHNSKFLPPAGPNVRNRTGLYLTGGGGGGRSASPASMPYISPPSNLEHCVHVPNEDIYCPTQPPPFTSFDHLGTGNFTNTASPIYRSRTPSETISPSCPCMLTMRSPTAWQNGQPFSPFSMNDYTGPFSPSGGPDDILVAGQFDFLEAFVPPDATVTDRFELRSTLSSCKSVPNLFEKSATTGRRGISQERHTISKGSSEVPTERKSKSRRIALSSLFHSSRKRSTSKRRKISTLENRTGEEKVDPSSSPPPPPTISQGVGVGSEDRRRSLTRHSSLSSLHLSTSVPTRSQKFSRPPKFFVKYLTPTRKKSNAANAAGGVSSSNNTGVTAGLTSSRRKKKSSVNTDEESLLSCTSRTRSADGSGSPVTGHADYSTNRTDGQVSSSTDTGSGAVAALASFRSLPRPPWYSPGVGGLRQLLTFPPVQLLEPVVERCRNVFGSSDRISRPSTSVRYSVLSRGANTMSRSLDALLSVSPSEDRSQTLLRPPARSTDEGPCGHQPIEATLWSAFRVVSIIPLLLGISSSPTAASPISSRPTLLEMAANAQQASASASLANTPDSQPLRVLLRHTPKITTNCAAPAPEHRLSCNRVKFSPHYGGPPDPDPSPPADKAPVGFLMPSEDQQKPLTTPNPRGRQLCRHWTPQRELSAPAESALTAGRKLNQPAPNHLHYPCHPYYHHQHHHHHHTHHNFHQHRLPLSIHCCYCSTSNDAHQTQHYAVGGQHKRDSFHALPSAHSGCCYCCCSPSSMHNDSYSPSSAAALFSPSGFVGLRISGRDSSPCPPATTAGSHLAHSDILNGERFVRLDSTATTASSSTGDGTFGVTPPPFVGSGVVPSRLTPSSFDAADAEHSHTTDYSPCSHALSSDSPQNISWTLAAAYPPSSRQSSTRSSLSRLSLDNPVAASRDAYLKVTQDGYLNRSAGDGSFDESEVSAPILHGTRVFSPHFSNELVSLHGYLNTAAGACTSMAGGDSVHHHHHQESRHPSFEDYRPASGEFDALEASFGAGEAAEDTATLYAELQQSDDACANVNSGSYEPVFPQNPFNYFNLPLATGNQQEPQCSGEEDPNEKRKVSDPSASTTNYHETPDPADPRAASPVPSPIRPQSTPCRRRLAFRSTDRRPPIILRNRIHTDTDDDVPETAFQDAAPPCSSVSACISNADLGENSLQPEMRTEF
uniref:CRIB domain-containing protein n=1 Tax=Schistocephalus solidus TaxID=70667 RepID=A0A0X3NH77_SCHSO